MRKFCSALIIFMSPLLLVPSIALAYVGPGAGLTAIGTVLALIGAILLGIFGFVWYPVKRLLRRRKTPEDDEIDDVDENPAAVKEQLESTPDDR